MPAWQDQLASLGRIGFDSNAMIYLLETRQPHADYVGQAIDSVQSGSAVGVLSTTVEMEVLVKPTRDQDINALDRIEVFFANLRNFIIKPVDQTIARRAAVVRAHTRLESIDAIIAATYMEEHCDAIIGNDAVMAARTTGIRYLYLNDYV